MMPVLAAVMYSPNLGDGLIAECITRIAAQGGMEPPRWLDIAGRQGFAAPQRPGLRAAALGVLEHLPRPAANLTARAALEPALRLKLRPTWRESLAVADGVLIGGGQLLADSSLNFPLKLNALYDEARRAGAPVALYGVGVSAHWSPAAYHLFEDMLTGELARVSVRDDASRENLIRHLAEMGASPPSIEVFPDPAFAAADLFGSVTKPGQGRPRIGLGVTHPVALRTHGAKISVPDAEFVRRYGVLARRLSEAGYEAVLFTNGAGEDERLAAALAAEFGMKGRVTLAPRAADPVGLAGRIAGFDGVIAHRLHANIVSYSYGIPQVGLGWDPKLEAFFAQTGRPDSLCAGDLSDPDAILAALHGAFDAPVDADRRKKLADEAKTGVLRALSVFPGG